MLRCITKACIRLWVLLLSFSFGADSTSAQDDADLYTAVAFVTGTEEPERSRGFRDGFKQAIVKLTGNAGLANSSRLAPYLHEAADLVASFEYEDRMKGIPVHDEQGTRERPHFLRIVFARSKLDNALVELSLTKWPVPRTRLAVLLAVDVPKGSFVLTRTGQNGYGQREVLKSVSDKRAIPISLPADDGGIAASDIELNWTKQIEFAASSAGAECPLSGTLKLDAQGIYWNMRWTLRCRGKSTSWSLDGVTYDVALASGLEESARILSQQDKLRR